MFCRFFLGHATFCYGTRAARSSAIVVSVALGLLTSCGSASGGTPVPVSAWAQSLDAQREARTIESAWRDSSVGERQATEPLILRFLDQYPKDPRANAMRLRLVWLKIESRHLDAADALIQRSDTQAKGVDADMAAVLRASILARRGQPAVALAHLRELGAGLVDGEVREFWAEQAMRVAVLAGSPNDAIAFMLAWRSCAPDEHQQRVESEVSSNIERFDAAARLLSLETLTQAAAQPSAEESRHRARLWLLELVRASLGKLAATTNDSNLARRLIADAPTAYVRSADGEQLRRLAQSLDVPEVSMHASIGLLLELDSDPTSRASAELVTGAMRALATASKDEPIRLITRELQAFDPTAAQQAIEALVADGAALLIAGLSSKTATLAAQLAAKRRISVILLDQPGDPVDASPFQFYVESPNTEVERIFREATRDSRQSTQLTSDDAFCRSEERLGWTPEFLTTRGDVLVATDVGCALRLATELRDHEGRVKVWLGPDAARAAEAFEDVTVITSSQMTEQSSSKPIVDWVARFQRLPSWYEALGYDIMRLGIEAIRKRGFDSLRGDTMVRAGREQIRSALSSVEAELVTTSQRGFAGKNSLRATLLARRVRGSDMTEKPGR